MAVGTRVPDRIFMNIDAPASVTRLLALEAQLWAKREAPKLSGRSANHIFPIYGRGWFGIKWLDDRVWFQNSGVRPFTMRSLAGKTIPMWIDDPTGAELAKNPKLKSRTTASGKKQVLIFRKAAVIGSRKNITRKIGGATQTISVPRSYPGAPGRIALREAGAPFTTPGKIAGAIVKGNVGIRWYFPGLSPRNFLQNGLITACLNYGYQPTAIYSGFDFYSNPMNKIVSDYPRNTSDVFQ